MEEVSSLTLKVNNKTYFYLRAMTIFQACLEKKIYVPRFCYHVALKIAGNCRMCLVEEKSSLKPVASCAVTIVAGMSIFTQTELVKRAREGVIEYLLINHPLDCPICDQGGECDLQDQTMVFGADRGRFYENKRSTPNKNLGFLVKSFLNRCIHCARCTRFLHDVAGTPDMGLLGRGLKTEISLYTRGFLKSEISGNIIDLCPVGALTSKPYAFRARPWELVSVYTFDISDGFGANIELNYRGLELLRILPRLNYEINEEWISDKTRFFYDSFGLQRLVTPFRIISGSYRIVSWLEGFILWKNVVNKFFFNLLSHKLGVINIMSLLGNYSDLEAVSSFYHLSNLASSVIDGFSNKWDSRQSYLMGSATKQFLFNAEYTKPTSIILVGVNTRLESPILNIKIRRFAEEESIKIFLVGFSSNLNFNFIHKNTVMDKQHILWLNVFIEGALLVTRINNAILGPVSYNIANNLAVIHQFDIFGYMLTNTRGQLSLLLGQPETYPTGVLTKFIVATLHHVEDDFWAFMKKVNGLKFPVKFYMEKFGSYLTESGYFFSTFTNIYGFSIRGTREEWKVIAALTEFIFPQYNKLNKLVPKFNNVTGRLQLFSGSFVFDNFCMRKERMGSIINNYYISDLLSRISPILTLCSKAYTVLNDYKIIITN